MRIEQILHHAARPPLDEPGNASMWDDPHISRQLLNVHLDPEADLASRKPESIHKTLEWITSNVASNPATILDLGCGPGLYTLPLARMGHRVMGIDLSDSSISYATKQAQSARLKIDYIVGNYLDTDLGENRFDLIIMIYTDFGVLIPAQRDALLARIHRCLKPGGLFLFDALNDTDFPPSVSGKKWEAQEKGFWSLKPHLALSESFLYEKEKVLLDQHLVLGEDGSCALYRFWTRFYSHNALADILQAKGFRDPVFRESLLSQDGPWRGDQITFCRVVK